MQRETKKITFKEKVMQDFYDTYPIEIHIEDVFFEMDEETKKIYVFSNHTITKNPLMNVIDIEEDHILANMIFDWFEKIIMPYNKAIWETIGPGSDDFEEIKDDYELLEEVRAILEDFIDKEMDKHVEKIKEIYYRAFILTFCD